MLAAVYRYHDGTKHAFQRYARSLGYLDWASQPRPFRDFTGAQVFPLFPAPGGAVEGSAAAIGDMLRHSLGLSAWKRFNTSRWALRVNPSSGNLHPTEAYVICGALPGLANQPAVYHYAPDRHALELRCVFDDSAWAGAFGKRRDVVLVALTSIHWREAWKYGERAFRYCQHDMGHAIAALSIAAGLVDRRVDLQPAWAHSAIATATGVEREDDFFEAEREEPGCIMAVSGGEPIELSQDAVSGLMDAIRRGQWSGRASQLSEDHVEWMFIDEVARATEDPGRAPVGRHEAVARPIYTRPLLLQRRSALGFDGQSTIAHATFVDMLSRVLPDTGAPFASLWWSPRVHLAIFVHRVEGLAPGLYILLRDPEVLDRLRAACRQDFLWEGADDRLPLWRLLAGDARALARRLSCDQDIASDGFFSLGMIADFDASLETFGPSFYRHLFWETGIIGQVLYLEAEAAGARATGIGCFFDDPVHDVLGLSGHAFQSLYHFTVGMPVEDTRLTTEPGYAWEKTQDFQAT